MNTTTIWSQYEARLSRVCDYIHDNLDEPLDLDNLAQIACLSPWHWHRIYRAVYGETVTATIKRLRLHRAASDLVQTDWSLESIAKRAGYSNIQSFNRTFKKVYDLPPGKFRACRGKGSFISKNPGTEFDMYQVEISKQDEFIVAGLNHKGPYGSVGIAFEKLNGLAMTRGIFDSNTRSIGIYYDDPTIVARNELRAFACMSVANSNNINAPLESGRIAGGNYAVFRYKGPYSNMETCYRWIYEDWLKVSGCELRDDPGFAEYLNPMEKSPSDLLTDIHTPLV